MKAQKKKRKQHSKYNLRQQRRKSKVSRKALAKHVLDNGWLDGHPELKESAEKRRLKNK